jgi:hypothetical protein
VLARPRTDELSHLAAGLSMVDLWAMRPTLLLVGSGHPAGEVTRELGIPVHAIPQDGKGARALCGIAATRGPRRNPTRSALGRAAQTVAAALTQPRAEPFARRSGHATVPELPVSVRLEDLR